LKISPVVSKRKGTKKIKQSPKEGEDEMRGLLAK